MATTTPYPAADLLPEAVQQIITRYPRTITWLLLAGLVEVFVQTVVQR